MASLCPKYYETGDIRVLNECIDIRREHVYHMGVDDPSCIENLCNLGLCFTMRYLARVTSKI